MTVVEVWRTGLEPEPDLLRDLAGLLSEDELQRARSFRFERDRRRHVAARGILRVLLGRATGTPPAQLRFAYGRFGKPALEDGGVQFNLSHSGAEALIAISPARELGIDLELLEHVPPDLDRIAERFFSPAEVAALHAVPAAGRDLAFLACWTRKEAFVKARGDGLSLPLDAFDVGFGADRPCAVLRTAWAPEDAAGWQLVDLSDPGRGYMAAIAARGRDWRVAVHDLALTDLTTTTSIPTLLEAT